MMKRSVSLTNSFPSNFIRAAYWLILNCSLIPRGINSLDTFRETCVYQESVRNISGIRAIAFHEELYYRNVPRDPGLMYPDEDYSIEYLNYLYLLDSDYKTYQLHINSLTTSNILQINVRLSETDYSSHLARDSHKLGGHLYSFTPNSLILVQDKDKFNHKNSSVNTPGMKFSTALSKKSIHLEIVIFNASTTYVNSWIGKEEDAKIHERWEIKMHPRHFTIVKLNETLILTSPAKVANIPDFTIAYRSKSGIHANAAVGLFKNGTYVEGQFADEGHYFQMTRIVRKTIVVANGSCVTQGLESTYPYKNEWFYVLAIVAFIAMSCVAFVCVDFESETNKA